MMQGVLDAYYWAGVYSWVKGGLIILMALCVLFTIIAACADKDLDDDEYEHLSDGRLETRIGLIVAAVLFGICVLTPSVESYRVKIGIAISRALADSNTTYEDKMLLYRLSNDLKFN